MANPIISITEDHFIASGAFCRCYRHPENRNECIKLTTDNKKSNKRLRADLAYLKKLHRRNIDLHYIADYIDTCATSLGKGYIFECVTNSDNSVSKTLEHYLTSREIQLDDYLEELHQLGIYLLHNRILISDLHAKNILLKLKPDEPPKPVIVDGLGDTVLITVQNVFKSHVQAKIIRRWNRFLKRILKNHPDLEPSLKTITLSERDISL